MPRSDQRPAKPFRHLSAANITLNRTRFVSVLHFSSVHSPVKAALEPMKLWQLLKLVPSQHYRRHLVSIVAIFQHGRKLALFNDAESSVILNPRKFLLPVLVATRSVFGWWVFAVLGFLPEPAPVILFTRTHSYLRVLTLRSSRAP
jgi:hypothetical protein